MVRWLLSGAISMRVVVVVPGSPHSGVRCSVLVRRCWRDGAQSGMTAAEWDATVDDDRQIDSCCRHADWVLSTKLLKSINRFDFERGSDVRIGRFRPGSGGGNALPETGRVIVVTAGLSTHWRSMAGARRALPRLTSRNPTSSSEPLPRRPVCSEYCFYRFMSVLYGISYFVSIYSLRTVFM